MGALEDTVAASFAVRSTSTRDNAQAVVRIIREVLGSDEELARLAEEPTQVIANALIAQGRNSRTVQVYLGLVRQILHGARARGLACPEPAASFLVPVLPAKLANGIHAIQLDTLDRAVPLLRSAPPPYDIALCLSALAGLAPYQLKELTVSDIRVVRGEGPARVRLWTKTLPAAAGAERPVAGALVPVLTPGALILSEYLRKARPRGALLPPHSSGALHRRWQPFHAALGLGTVSSDFKRDLRRLYVRHLLEAGLERWECGLLLGQGCDLAVDGEAICQRVERYDMQRRRLHDHAGVRRSAGAG